MARRLLLFCAALLAACAASPSPCFNQPSLILNTQILAVRVDPPESIADLSGADPLVPSSITALVVTGVLDQNEQYGAAPRVIALPTAVSICLLPLISDVNAQPGCPDGSMQVASLPAIPDEMNPLVYTPPLSLLQAAVAQDPLHGLTGVQLRLQLDVTAPEGNIRITKDLYYQLKGSALPVNHALELIGMETSQDGMHASYPSPDAIPLLVGVPNGLRPLIGPGAGASSAIETYLAYDNHGALTQLQEHITYAFYGGNALFFGTPNGMAGNAIYTGAPGDVADEPPAGTDPPDGLATVEPVFEGPQANLFWVVAYDGRGGVAWEQVGYSAKDLRACYASGRCPVIFFGCG